MDRVGSAGGGARHLADGSAPVRDDVPMLGDVLGKLGDAVGGDAARVDPRKIVDLIDDLWGARHDIVDAVDYVVANRAAIGAAIAFAQDHADDLIELGKRLPPLLATAGAALEQAGDGAAQAGRFLLGGGTSRTGVRALAAEAADALDRCQRELAEITALVDRVGGSLADVPMVGDALAPLASGAGRMGAVADDLGHVARRVRELGATIGGAGGDLSAVGRSLGRSGSTLQRLSGAPAVTAAAPAARAPRRARPTAKRRTTGAPPARGTRTTR